MPVAADSAEFPEQRNEALTTSLPVGSAAVHTAPSRQLPSSLQVLLPKKCRSSFSTEALCITKILPLRGDAL